MSIASCGRAGCKNVMCEIMVDNKYICKSCYGDLLIEKSCWDSNLTKKEILNKIRFFMKHLSRPIPLFDFGSRKNLNRLFNSFFHW